MTGIEYHRLLFICLALLMLNAGNSSASAEQHSGEDEAKFYWITAGGGLSSSDVCVDISCSHGVGNSLVSLRFAACSEFVVLFSTASPIEETWDMGVLWGKTARISHSRISVSAGVGFAGGVKRGRLLSTSGSWLFTAKRYEKIEFFTAALLVEGQLFWAEASPVGVGIYGFANLNRERSFGGVAVNVLVGKLK
jgi:hypothetical protein